MAAQWKTFALFAALAGQVLLLPLTANATPAYLVDTGPGPDNVDISQVPSALLSVDQWLGFKFVTENSVRIGGVEGWMSVIPGGQGFGRVAIYEDNSNAPGALLYSDSFTGLVTDPTGLYRDADWLGALDLDWKIKSGSYWITFEADGGGLTAGLILGSPTPVFSEIYRPCCAGADWVNATLELGVRVSKRVPEPGTLALLALGLTGIAVRRRRKSNCAVC